MKWFNNLLIGTKFYFAFGIIILMFLGISAYTVNSILVLSKLDEDSQKRAEELTDVFLIESEVSEIYTHIADAIINKDLSNSKALLANDKSKMKSNITKLNELVDTEDERAELKKIELKYAEYLGLFENKVIPLLDVRTEEAQIELVQIDEQIDVVRGVLLKQIEKIRVSLRAEAEKAGLVYIEESRSTIIAIIVVLVIVTLLAFVFAKIIADRIGKPIKQTMHMLEELSKGHISSRLEVKSTDELGQMATTMNAFAIDLQKNTIETLKKVAAGETNLEISAKDDKDEISPALQQLVNTIKNLINEMSVLAESALEGKLKSRGNPDKFGGGYKQIVQGVNNTLDAIVNPIEEGSKVLQIMAEGDFRARVNGSYKGDLSIITTSINKLGDSISEIISDVTDAVEATSSASNQISSSSEEMAAGAQEQSSQTSEVAAAVEEMTKTIWETSKHASSASIAAQNAETIAREGGKTVNNTIAGMNLAADVVQISSEKVQKLGQSSEQIGEIIQVINDIADQTNLLALNAAIEAARAGEQGRGFAVVADEVRKLAERTTKATKEIALMIKQIQLDTAEAVLSMDKGKLEVEEGKSYAHKAGESLGQIIKSTIEVLDMVSQVAAANEELSSTAEEISKNMDGINSVTQESAAGIQQIAKASEDLSNLTVNLQQTVGKFKIDNNNSKPIASLNKSKYLR